MSEKSWSEQFGSVDPYEEDSKPKPNKTPRSEYEEDENGEYNPNAGAQCREQALEAGRCGAVLSYWRSWYGERRYCTRMPENVFIIGGLSYCWVHKGRKDDGESKAGN